MKIEEVFRERLNRHHDELRWLYMELYNNSDMFAELCDQMYRFAMERAAEFRRLDTQREKAPGWFRKNDMLGMMLYIDNFAGNLKGVKEKLDYLKSCNVNCLHLMPFLETTKGRSDGGVCGGRFPEGAAGAWNHEGPGGAGKGMP